MTYLSCPFCAAKVPEQEHAVACYLNVMSDPTASLEDRQTAWNTRRNISPLGWMVSVNGMWEFFRTYDQALRERQEYEGDDHPEDEREVPVMVYKLC